MNLFSLVPFVGFPLCSLWLSNKIHFCMLQFARNKTILLSFFLLMAFVPIPEKKIKIWMIGDSTMCLYETNRLPLKGWGMPFADFFDSSIVIDNRARGGRSTRTFISENR